METERERDGNMWPCWLGGATQLSHTTTKYVFLFNGIYGVLYYFLYIILLIIYSIYIYGMRAAFGLHS